MASFVWVFVPLEVIIVVACCLGNVMVIWAVWKCRAFKKPTFCFIVSLAVADFLVGSVAIPVAVLWDVSMKISFHGCLFICCFFIMLQMASGGLLLAIAVDRFLRVCIPLKYKSIVTQKRVWIVVALCWFTAALPSFVPMFGWYNHTTWNGTTYANSTHITCSYFTVNARSYLVNVIFFVFFLPSLAVMTGLYCYIFLIARRQLRVNIGLAIMSRKYYKKEQRLATSLGLVLFLFAVCWLPILVMHTLIHYGKINVSRVTIRIAVVLSHANSAVNPIVYALKISKIREVCRKLWWKRKPSCRTEAEQSNANSTADSSDKKSSRLTNSNA